MAAGSHFDAMVSHDMVAFFVLALVPVDLFVFYYIHKTSLMRPYYNCCKLLFKPVYPNHYMTFLTHQTGAAPPIASMSSTDTTQNVFSLNVGQICVDFLSTKHSFLDYCMIALQVWSFCCGVLAFYGSFIFWMNLLLQFFITCTGSSSALCLFGLLSFYFIFEVIYWFIRRQFESVILLTRNVGDVFHLRLLPMVRLYNVLLCLLCTIWTQLHSNQVGWKYFVLFMLLRGLYHQMVYVTLMFFSTVLIVLRSMRECNHFCKLICVVSTLLVANEKHVDCCTRSSTKMCYILFLWLLLIVYLGMMAVHNECRYVFKVCVVFISLYYVLIMFERGKYPALYYLWREKLSRQFFLSLPSTKSRLHTLNATADLHVADIKHLGYYESHRRSTQTPSLQIEIQPSKSDNLHKFKSKSKSVSSNKSAPQFSIIEDQSDEDEDYPQVNEINIRLDQDDIEEDEQQKLSPNGAAPHAHTSNAHAAGEQHQPRESRPSTHSAEHGMTPMEYRTYWDQVSFSEETRCKCFTLCTGECSQLCCREYCSACCCSRDGAKWSFAVCIFVLFLFGTTGAAHRWLLFEEKSYDTNLNVDTRQTYPVCDLQYNSYLNAVDLTFLSIAAHQETTEAVRYDLNLWFGSTANEWQMTENSTSIHRDPYFYHVYNRQHDIDIVAIRTEPDPAELLLDIGLWSEVAMFEVFSWVIPLTSILPKAFLRQYVEFVSIFEKIIAPHIRDTFDEPVYEYVKHEILENPVHINEKSEHNVLLLVGHSLAGGVAQMVGARLYDEGYGYNGNIISFGLSSPGLVYSSGKFGFTVESLDKSAVSVVARRDIIASIDARGGFVQYIECTAASDEECHGSVTSFCELYDECDDNLVRNMTFVQCVCQQKREWDDCR